jgi:glycosyltransferase involved in cell wall biosynthesis
MRLAVIIPALNEEATIADLVQRIPRKIDRIVDVRVIVVDDGSTDATARKAELAGALVIRHATNLGVGAAFGTGVRTALEIGADLVVNMDGDGQFDPGDIPQLLRPIVEDGAGFATCTRFGNPDLIPDMPWLKRMGNIWMSRLVGWLSWRRQFTDVSCGFRAYTRDTLLRLNLYGRYTYTQETFINLAAKNIPMTEVPLSVRGTRAFGESRVAPSISKYVLRAVPIIFRTFRDLRPLLFFGSIALIVLIVGLALGGFVFLHWVDTGNTSPFRSLLLGSGVAIILSFLLGVLAFLADMLNRHRKLLEEAIYLLRLMRSSSDSGSHAALAEKVLTDFSALRDRDPADLIATREQEGSVAIGSNERSEAS